MSEGLAECEWIGGVLESALYQDYEPSLHRRKSILLPAEPTVTIMKADSHLQVDPSTVCVIDAKSAFDHLVRMSTGGHCRVTATRTVCDQEKYANTEGEVQMGTTRADGSRRIDEEAWEQRYDVATVARRSPIVDEDRELAMRKVNRETHKRNQRPHRQVEQAQTREYDRLNVVGCSHTIKADEASGSDP